MYRETNPVYVAKADTLEKVAYNIDLLIEKLLLVFLDFFVCE